MAEDGLRACSTSSHAKPSPIINLFSLPSPGLFIGVQGWAAKPGVWNLKVWALDQNSGFSPSSPVCVTAPPEVAAWFGCAAVCSLLTWSLGVPGR
jgi:hypothetical protein